MIWHMRNRNFTIDSDVKVVGTLCYERFDIRIVDFHLFNSIRKRNLLRFECSWCACTATWWGDNLGFRVGNRGYHLRRGWWHSTRGGDVEGSLSHTLVLRGCATERSTAKQRKAFQSNQGTSLAFVSQYLCIDLQLQLRLLMFQL